MDNSKPRSHDYRATAEAAKKLSGDIAPSSYTARERINMLLTKDHEE